MTIVLFKRDQDLADMRQRIFQIFEPADGITRSILIQGAAQLCGLLGDGDHLLVDGIGLGR